MWWPVHFTLDGVQLSGVWTSNGWVLVQTIVGLVFFFAPEYSLGIRSGICKHACQVLLFKNSMEPLIIGI